MFDGGSVVVAGLLENSFVIRESLAGLLEFLFGSTSGVFGGRDDLRVAVDFLSQRYEALLDRRGIRVKTAHGLSALDLPRADLSAVIGGEGALAVGIEGDGYGKVWLVLELAQQVEIRFP